MKLNVFGVAKTIVFTVLENIAVEGSAVTGCRKQWYGWRKNQFIPMFPTEFTCDRRLEGNIFGRIPVVDQRVGDQGFIETEYQISQRRHFIFGVGKIEVDQVTVA